MNEMSRHQVWLREEVAWSAKVRDRALRVRYGDGGVWVTKECDSRDAVLHAGGRRLMRADGLPAVRVPLDAVIATEFRGGNKAAVCEC